MKRFVILAVVGLLPRGTASANAQSHPFTVRDDIEMTRFSDPYPLSGVVGSEIAKRSPDGKHFVVVTTRGILKSDLLQSTVWIFDINGSEAMAETSDMSLRYRRRPIAAVTSYPHHSEAYAYPTVIKDVRWSSDSAYVYFIGEDHAGTFRVYQATINGSGFHAITPAIESVIRYDLSPGTLVYRATKVSEDNNRCKESISSGGRAVTGESLQDILFSDELPYIAPQVSMVWKTTIRAGDRSTRQIPGSRILDLIQSFNNFMPFAVSPNGRWLVELRPAQSVPKSWEKYDPGAGFEERRIQISDPRLLLANNPLRPKRYTLIDLATGKQVPLIDGPSGFALAYGQSERAVWSSDDRSVLVSNVLLPLNEGLIPPITSVLDPVLSQGLSSKTLPSVAWSSITALQPKT